MRKLVVLGLALALAGAAATPGRAVFVGDLEIMPSIQSLYVDGKNVTGAESYNINGENYFRLRDMAMLLSVTDARFAVDYDAAANAVTITTGGAYVPLGRELTRGPDLSAECVPIRQSLTIDGKAADLRAYNMGGNNYFRLRDLGRSLGFGVDYDAKTNSVLVTTATAQTVRLGTSDCFLTLPAAFTPRESGGYENPLSGVRFEVYELAGSAKALAEAEAGGAAVTEATVNGVDTLRFQSGGTLTLFADAGGGKVEKLAFTLPDGDDAPAKQIIDSLTKLLVIPLGDSPLRVAASPVFQKDTVRDSANGQTAAYADEAEQRYFDLYLHSYDGSFDAFVSERAASYGGKAGGIVTYTPLVKYFTVSGEWMSALIDLGGGRAAELRFRPVGDNMDWAMEILRSLRAG